MVSISWGLCTFHYLCNLGNIDFFSFLKKTENAENQTRGCWVRSKNAIHSAMRGPRCNILSCLKDEGHITRLSMYRVKMVWINRMRWVCNFWGFQEDQWFVDSSHSRTFQDLVKKWEKLVSYLNRKTLSNLNETTSSGDAGYSTLSHLFIAIYLYACQRLYYMEDTSFCLKLSRCRSNWVLDFFSSFFLLHHCESFRWQ